MPPIPKPAPGLILRYGYLWLEELRSGRVDPSKDRPACILMQAAKQAADDLPLARSASIASGDVIIFPITTRPLRAGDLGVELLPDEKRLCRLDPEIPSWLVVSEFNADSWPNPDIALIPGTSRFAYGHASPGLMRRIAREVRRAQARGAILGVKRYEG